MELEQFDFDALGANFFERFRRLEVILFSHRKDFGLFLLSVASVRVGVCFCLEQFDGSVIAFSSINPLRVFFEAFGLLDARFSGLQKFSVRSVFLD